MKQLVIAVLHTAIGVVRGAVAQLEMYDAYRSGCYLPALHHGAANHIQPAARAMTKLSAEAQVDSEHQNLN